MALSFLLSLKGKTTSSACSLLRQRTRVHAYPQSIAASGCVGMFCAQTKILLHSTRPLIETTVSQSCQSSPLLSEGRTIFSESHHCNVDALNEVKGLRTSLEIRPEGDSLV